MGLTGDTAVQVLIPLAAVAGILFSLLQCFLVSRVRVGGDSRGKGGYSDRLLEEDEEEGAEDPNAVAKCAEIQNAISVGKTTSPQRHYKYVATFMIFIGITVLLVLCYMNKSFNTESEYFIISAHGRAIANMEGRKNTAAGSFLSAFGSGVVLGFLLLANGICTLCISILFFL